MHHVARCRAARHTHTHTRERRTHAQDTHTQTHNAHNRAPCLASASGHSSLPPPLGLWAGMSAGWNRCSWQPAISAHRTHITQCHVQQQALHMRARFEHCIERGPCNAAGPSAATLYSTDKGIHTCPQLQLLVQMCTLCHAGQCLCVPHGLP